MNGAEPIPVTKNADSGYFEHGADVGIFGRGASPELAFQQAARAMFALMTETGRVAAKESVAFEFDEPDLELALVTWLNGLLSHAADRGLALAHFALERADSHWKGRAWGEPWRPGLERGTGVKGATLTMLSVANAGGAWDARCVVDV